MHIDDGDGSVHFKLAYFGPGFAGKNACLSYVWNRTRPPAKTPLQNVYTEPRGRQVWFCFTPLSMPPIDGRHIVFDMHTNSGALWNDVTRSISLEDADGVMFVADSTAVRQQANVEALRSLDRLLATGIAAAVDVPRVFSYNKRDLMGDGGPLPVAELERALNPDGRPSFATVGTTGINVFAALKCLAAAVLRPHQDEAGRG